MKEWLPIIALGVFIIYTMWQRWASPAAHRVALLKKYGRITMPIIEYQRDEEDREVFVRAERHRALLVESGNKWNIQVYEIYFCEAGHWGEDFNTYLWRVKKTTERITNQWMADIKRRDPEAYRVHLMGQV